jgi:hypothetical protein
MTCGLMVVLLLLFGQHRHVRHFDSLQPGLNIQALRQVQHSFGVEVLALDQPVRYGTFWNGLTVNEAPEFVVSGILPVLCRELEEYPLGFFQAIRLRRIVLCTGLRQIVVNRIEPASGLACITQDTVFVAVEDLSEGREFELRKRLHHEIFHIMDDRAGWAAPFGKWYRGYTYDREWTDLNGSNYCYLPRSSKDLEVLEPGKDPAINSSGFVSHYSRTNELEDKAETFAHLMTLPAIISKRCETDLVLRRKVEFMKARVRLRFRGFDPQFRRGETCRERPKFTFRSVVEFDSSAGLGDVVTSDTKPSIVAEVGFKWSKAGWLFALLVLPFLAVSIWERRSA